MLIVPFSHDQPDNAARMARLGVARTIRRREYSAATAAAALNVLLNDASYAAQAARASEALRQEDGAARAADAIESTAARRAPAP